VAEETENTEEEKKEEKKSNPMMIIIGGVLVLLLVIGGVLAFLLSGGEEEEMAKNGPTASAGASGGEAEERPSTFNSPRRKSSLEVGPMYEMDQFIVNLMSDGGRRYLKIKVNLELEDEAMVEEITSKLPVLRDTIIRIASSKSLEEISTQKGKDGLKDQIVNEINANMKDGKINNIYFTDFVVQ
jgi:flagellar FliL protein